MSQEVEIRIKAVDEASREIGGMAKSIDHSLDEVSESAAQAAKTQNSLGNAVKETASTAKSLVTGFSEVAKNAYSLYNAYDRVADMQLNVERANLKVKSSANSLEDAQRTQTRAEEDLEKAQAALAHAIDKCGVGNKDAAEAQEEVNRKLADYEAASRDAEIAAESYDVAVDAAKQTQNNFNEAIVQSAVQIVPTAVTLVDNIAKVCKSLEAARDWGGKILDKLSSLKDVDFTVLLTKLGLVDTSLKGIATSAGLAAGAIAAIAGIMYVGATTSEAKAYEQIIPQGVPKPPLTPGQTETPFGIPSLGFKKQMEQFIFGGWKQEGGIFTKPTIIGVGEAGPEAVIPLGREVRSSSEFRTQYVTINPVIQIGSIDKDVNPLDVIDWVNTGLAEALRKGDLGRALVS